MAVKIRLKRMGKMRAPYYRIVVADSRTKRDGRAIEEIGLYHPTNEPSTIHLDSERVQYWLGVGAQPTEQVMALLKITGDWQRHKGLPGAEGTLKVAEPKADKKAVFEAAAKESLGQSSAAATTPRSKRKAEPKAAGDKPEASQQPPGAPDGAADTSGQPAAAEPAAAEPAAAEPAAAEPVAAESVAAESVAAESVAAESVAAESVAAESAAAESAATEQA